MDRPLYAFAAGAVRAMVSRVGWEGLLRVLAAIRTEQDIASAYGRVAGESLNTLEHRLADSAAPGIVSTGTPDAGGNVSWTLYAGRASAEVLVRISGAKGYAVTFTVRTDAFGMYRGSFGSTASAGTYTISAAGAVATIVSGR
jgi:hypothetical protein